MTSNDANGIAPANRPSLRRDDAVGKAPEPTEIEAQPAWAELKRSRAWARIERVWWVGLGGAMLVFSAFPIANQFLGLSTKDYGLWYQVGLAVRQGLDIYPRPETGRLFPFMYPPSAAAMLAWVSLLGPIGSLLALLLVNSAAWVVCIWLSVWLAAGPRARRHPLVVIVPSLSHHRVGLQCLPVGSAQPGTPGTPVGVVCLPSARAADRRRGPLGHGRGHQGVPDSGPRLPDLPTDVDRLGRDGGRAGGLASDRAASFSHTCPGGRRSGRLVTGYALHLQRSRHRAAPVSVLQLQEPVDHGAGAPPAPRPAGGW